MVIDFPRDPSNPNKRNQQWKRIRGSKKEAENYLSEKLHQVQNKDLKIDEHLLFRTHLENWLIEKEHSVVYNTFTDYSNIVQNHIIPELGHMKVGEIEPEHLTRYYVKMLKKGLAPSTVRKHHRVFKQVFKPLTIRRKINYNPADLVSPPVVKDEFEANVLFREQIIDVIAKAKVFYSYIYVVILIALATGMRRSEIAGLMWDCVDLTTGTIIVRRQYNRTENGLEFVKRTKTKGSKRIVTIPVFVVNELVQLKEQQEHNKKMLGNEYTDLNLVCCWPDGRPFNPDWISRSFKKFQGDLNLNIRLHDTRHSHATLLAEFRACDKEVLERLGHVTEAMKRHYTHVTGVMNDYISTSLEENVFQSVAKKIELLSEQQKNQGSNSNMFDHV